MYLVDTVDIVTAKRMVQVGFRLAVLIFETLTRSSIQFFFPSFYSISKVATLLVMLKARARALAPRIQANICASERKAGLLVRYIQSVHKIR